MKTRTIVMALIAVLVSMFVYLYAYLVVERELEYEFVGCYPTSESYGPTWYAIHDTGFFTKDIFRNEYRRLSGKDLPEDTLDGEGVFVVCYNSTLEKLTYREFSKSGRFKKPSVNLSYYGTAYLKETPDHNVVNIYVVKSSVLIDMNVHDTDPQDTIIVEP